MLTLMPLGMLGHLPEYGRATLGTAVVGPVVLLAKPVVVNVEGESVVRESTASVALSTPTLCLSQFNTSTISVV